MSTTDFASSGVSAKTPRRGAWNGPASVDDAGEQIQMYGPSVGAGVPPGAPSDGSLHLGAEIADGGHPFDEVHRGLVVVVGVDVHVP